MTQLGEDTAEAGAADKPRILHISGDFPDSFDVGKTRVIETLVDLTTAQFDHDVVSINRIAPAPLSTLFAFVPGTPLKVETAPFEYGTAVRYHAPGKGILHATKLRQLGEWLAEYIAGQPHRPDLIVAHKLAIEGIAVHMAARRLGIPYAVSIQGDTDTKILGVRPDLASTFRRILDGAAMVFPFSHWGWEAVTAKLGLPAAPHVMLPCPTDLDTPLPPVSGGSSFVSVFHLKSHRRKNLANMVKAMRLLEEGGEATGLTIYGGGSETDRAQCEAIVGETRSVTLAGPRDREEVRAGLNAACGFVLPSLRETFGLVFIEALFAGVPIIYPRGTAIDGYFTDAPFAIGVDARDPRAIAAALRHLRNNESELKSELARWQHSDHAKQFQRPNIAAAFAEGLRLAMSGKPPR